MDKDTDRVWAVTFYGLENGRYRGHVSKNVIAKTLIEACAKVKKVNGDAVFISVNHKGAIDL
jgi:hypothetical protein